MQFLENFVTYNLVGDANHDNSIACVPLYLCTFLLNGRKRMVEMTINNIAIKFEEWIEWVGVTIGCVITLNMVVYTGRCHASFDWDVYIKMKRGKSKNYIKTLAPTKWEDQIKRFVCQPGLAYQIM